MSAPENLGSFFKENKKLLKEYLDTRLEVYKLKLIHIISKSAGYFIWIIVSLFLVFLFATFIGLVAGFWISDITGSYVKGFGIATLIILSFILLLALFRKALFVNPIIRNIIKRAGEEKGEKNEDFPEGF